MASSLSPLCCLLRSLVSSLDDEDDDELWSESLSPDNPEIEDRSGSFNSSFFYLFLQWFKIFWNI